MPRIDWPQQPNRIREAWLRHHAELPAFLSELTSLAPTPNMTAQEARAFLRCFYAARDLDRAERDLAEGGPMTESFAASALKKRVGELERHVLALEQTLQGRRKAAGNPERPEG